ncbi:MAG: universal stress protein [Bacillota bacterium]|nr:universal stress protein [Bacillota bacterium]
MSETFKRSTPEEQLKKYYDELEQSGKGKLKIFIGYAPGVGKTYSMLNEANRRMERGEEILIGYLEAHARKDTIEQIGKLQTISRKKVLYNNLELEEMNTDEILRIKPETVVVDELAHTNVPGSKYKKRYEDVIEILNNGINVLSTLNIQHLESLNDVVRQITGIKVAETIPDKIVENADEVVVVDLTPAALQNRLKRGMVYKNENVDRALKNFFRKGNLNALRELALRQTADEVDEELEEYMKEHGINENWHTVERVMVCISPNAAAKKLIRRGARIAKRYKCEWLVVSVDCTHIFAPKLMEKDINSLESHRKLAQQLGGKIVDLKGKSISRELSNFATETHVTQIIIGNSRRTKLQTLVRGSTVNKLLKLTNNIEVHVIPTD